jgi:D-sedoheptulose 7-phosphate isomerase
MELGAKVRRCAAEAADTQHVFFDENADAIVACARALNDAFAAGGRLFTFGNGGSACDAQHVAVEFAHPVFAKRAALPALALPCDVAHLTAVANDQDFTTAFASQLAVFGRAGDVALALSTSGQSASVVRGLAAARALGMITIGLTGRDGGKMPAACDHCFVVRSFSIHRIQETHVALFHMLWDLVHVLRGEEDLIG